MLDVVRDCAPAKLNLHLEVYPKRSDGYHPIKSIFQTISLVDDLVVSLSGKSLSCVVECDAMQLPVENTLTKTYRLFCQISGVTAGVRVKLTKRIPSGAGLGGGSSDAATFLLILNRMFDYPLGLNQLEEIANSFSGVETSFAIQAGREVRIVVKPEVVSDDQMVLMSHEIASRIENELEYPGQIKVNVIRESRAVDYAK
jgi:4-diphosphocytidyl-2C-methyl-D-erythritol kinase